MKFTLNEVRGMTAGLDAILAKELPVKFSNVLLWQGSENRLYEETVINTGDIIMRG